MKSYSGTVKVFEDNNGSLIQQGNDIQASSQSVFSSLSDDSNTVDVGISTDAGPFAFAKVHRYNETGWHQLGDKRQDVQDGHNIR